MVLSASIRLTAVSLATVLVVAGCADRREPAPIVFRGSQPGATRPAPVTSAPLPGAASPVAAAPDAAGVVDYGGYRAVIARQGDTLESLAARAGVSASALAAYNGYPAGYVPRAGEEVILPPDSGSRPASAPGPATAPAIVAAPLSPPQTVPDTPAPVGPAPAPTTVAAAPAPSSGASAPPTRTFDLSRIEAAITEPSPAATPQQVVVPPAPSRPDDASRTATVAPPAVSRAAPPPVTTAAPAPAQPAPEPPRPAATAPVGRFVKPVSGEIVRPFGRASGGRTDGVDFGATAGAEVRAVAPGQVALVSEALGNNLGTVILIRHADQILTVYGRVNSAVSQGQRVQAGDVIGTVAPAPGGGRDSLHFEVRRGTEPVDPAPFF